MNEEDYELILLAILEELQDRVDTIDLSKNPSIVKPFSPSCDHNTQGPSYNMKVDPEDLEK